MKQLLADPAFPVNKPVQMPNGIIFIPLHVAIMQRNTAAEQLLLEAGAACGAGSSNVYKGALGAAQHSTAAQQQRRNDFRLLRVRQWQHTRSSTSWDSNSSYTVVLSLQDS